MHLHHADTGDLNFQIFTGMTSEMFDVRQFILFCSIMPFPNITPITTLPPVIDILMLVPICIPLNESTQTPILFLFFFWKKRGQLSTSHLIIIRDRRALAKFHEEHD